VKPIDRKKSRLGYNRGEDNKVYEAVSINKKDYNWGKMITVHDGNSNSYPLHPEHQKKIRNLKPNESTKFKDETGRIVNAERSPSGALVHLKGAGDNRTISVAHKHFTESLDESFTIRSVGDNTHVIRGGKVVKRFSDPKEAQRYIAQRELATMEENTNLSEDDIIDAISELAELEGIELTEELFNELYTSLTTELSESKPTSARESFLKKYVEPEMIPHDEQIQEELSYLPESQLVLILNLYEELDEQNKAIFRQTMNDPDMINNFMDFALTNGDD
jgi:hypothetical protein